MRESTFRLVFLIVGAKKEIIKNFFYVGGEIVWVPLLLLLMPSTNIFHKGRFARPRRHPLLLQRLSPGITAAKSAPSKARFSAKSVLPYDSMRCVRGGPLGESGSQRNKLGTPGRICLQTVGVGAMPGVCCALPSRTQSRRRRFCPKREVRTDRSHLPRAAISPVFSSHDWSAEVVARRCWCCGWRSAVTRAGVAQRTLLRTAPRAGRPADSLGLWTATTPEGEGGTFRRNVHRARDEVALRSSALQASTKTRGNLERPTTVEKPEYGTCGSGAGAGHRQVMCQHGLA